MVTRIKKGTTVAQQAATQMAADVATKVQKNVKRAVAGTLGISGERMTKVDTAWLRMDCDANLTMIVGVWQLAPGIKYAAVRADRKQFAQVRPLQAARDGGRCWRDLGQ